ncbi:endonuclease/exonuclease/phosphatase family protein [Meridianimarinicoccus sp. MJW13]|uniref:endonuclease/exonuclease/phosphatase family protein n=1 Tax=Meridianimarinicoccus sp. MJW13 TaxID=2720031 RepID=UPI0018669382|nr:endonuclease/exonuclease/phosphatase family protein [Fluviibacterium sp. MJW13]
MTRQLRLASYNIRKAVGLDYRRDPGRILDVINSLDADVVAIQEADKRLGNRPTAMDVEALLRDTDFQIARLADNDVSLGWHGNAVLVRRGLTIHRVDRIELPGLEPRGAVQVDVGTDTGHLTVVGTHLGLLRPYRLEQLARIRAHLAETGAGATAILGDFNEWSDTAGLEPLADGFEVISPGRSFHSARPMAGLDRIALSTGVALRDAGVEQGKLAKVASDHLPIWGDVTLPDLTRG